MKSLPKKSLELAFATPYVMSIRMMRMATSGFPPSPEDTREFNRMWFEKIEAFGESWYEMSYELMKQNQKLMTSYSKLPFDPWAMTSFHMDSLHKSGKAGKKVLKKGLAPVHSKAVANAKRLTK